MANRRPAQLLIEHHRQFRAMRSQLRQEILATLRVLEPCSVNEIAADLGRAAEPLYYHIHLLRDTGLVREAGRRQVGRREELLYERSSDRLHFHPTRSTPAFVSNLRKAYSHLIRSAERSLLAATGSPGELREGKGKNVRMQIYEARLDAEALRELNARLDQVRDFLMERTAQPGTGRVHQVTLMMSPK